MRDTWSEFLEQSKESKRLGYERGELAKRASRDHILKAWRYRYFEGPHLESSRYVDKQ